VGHSNAATSVAARRDRRRGRPSLLCYVILRETDTSWELAQKAGHRNWALWMVLVTLAPLLLPALPAYRDRSETFLDIATRVWPAAALAVFFVAQTPRASGALHVLLGLSVPLAVLAVQGVLKGSSILVTRPRVTTVVLLALIAPPLIYQLDRAHDVVQDSLRVSETGNRASPRFIDPGERDSLAWLRDDPRDGGVMANGYLGVLVPGETGRATYVGNSYWSGGSTSAFFASGAVNALLSGTMSVADSRQLVRSSGAAFILAGCAKHVDLASRLPGSVSRARRFGCADVFVIRA
jgi:hypothetical protein